LKNVLFSTLRASLAASVFTGVICAHAQEPLAQDDFFPIVLYNHWSRTTVDRMLEVIDNAYERGWNTVNVFGGGEQVQAIQAHAQAKGMALSAFCGSLIKLRPSEVPKLCVHSPEYEADLHKFLEPKRAEFESLPRFWVADINDESCILTEHVCRCEHCQQAFKDRYGVELPEKPPPVTEPVLRRQYVEFYDDYWVKGWKLTCDYMKANDPNLLIGNTYTENLCLGRHVELVFGDLLRWAEPLDWLAADIYPYYYGRHENDADAIEGDMRRSRLLLAFLRCAGRQHGIPFAWWVGCTSSTEETPKAIRHMSYTAIGQGAQGLIGWGAYFPETRPVLEYNPALWEDAGRTFRDIGKIGPLLRHLRKTSRIALLASETEGLMATPRQYVGPFYYDLVPAYDALLRGFGNADLIYERQIAAGGLKDYEALVLANVRHIADAAAKGIEEFVSGGGVLVSDTVPELNENNERSQILTEVMGRTENSGRERRVHYGAPDAFPSVVTSEYGKGKVVLLRFRIGSFYRVPQLWELLRSLLEESGVHPLAVSSNPDIESNYLAGEECFVIVAVNRTRQDGRTEITCFRPPFAPKQVRDLINDQELPFGWSEEDEPSVLSIALEVEGISGRVIGVHP
jgi:hypothetical protein